MQSCWPAAGHHLSGMHPGVLWLHSSQALLVLRALRFAVSLRPKADLYANVC